MYMMIIMGLLLKLSLSWLLLLNSYSAVNAAVELSGVRRGCNSSCGNLVVPYPFGIGAECAANPELYITCNYSNTPPIPFIREQNLEILSISESEVRIKNFVSYQCHNQSGQVTDSLGWSFDLSEAGGSYTFSDKRNKFISVGCSTYASFESLYGNYSSGCISLCGNRTSIVNGSCSGMGCCQTSIPKRLTSFVASADSITGTEGDTADWRSRKCTYAFLGDPDKYKFQESDLTDPNFINRTEKHVPVVLDNLTCKEALQDRANYACQINNTDCIESDNRRGYRCICRRGYEGNPYLEPGCQDINECADSSKNRCVNTSMCVNTLCGYTCTCPGGTYGNGREDGQGCIPITKKITKNSRFPTTKIILGIGLGILFLLIGIFFLYVGLKERRLAKLKKRFFKQNGG